MWLPSSYGRGKLPLPSVVGVPNIESVGRRQRNHRERYDCALIPAFRRVERVRLIVDDGPLRAEVCGIGHRFPTTVPVSVKLAIQLVEAGAPLTVVTGSSISSPVGVS